jgi:hypothetical protein
MTEEQPQWQEWWNRCWSVPERGRGKKWHGQRRTVEAYKKQEKVQSQDYRRQKMVDKRLQALISGATKPKVESCSNSHFKGWRSQHPRVKSCNTSWYWCCCLELKISLATKWKATAVITQSGKPLTWAPNAVSVSSSWGLKLQASESVHPAHKPSALRGPEWSRLEEQIFIYL